MVCPGKKVESDLGKWRQKSDDRGLKVRGKRPSKKGRLKKAVQKRPSKKGRLKKAVYVGPDQVSLQGTRLETGDPFKCLGSIVTTDNDMKHEMTARIQNG